MMNLNSWKLLLVALLGTYAIGQVFLGIQFYSYPAYAVTVFAFDTLFLTMILRSK